MESSALYRPPDTQRGPVPVASIWTSHVRHVGHLADALSEGIEPTTGPHLPHRLASHGTRQGELAELPPSRVGRDARAAATHRSPRPGPPPIGSLYRGGLRR